MFVARSFAGFTAKTGHIAKMRVGKNFYLVLYLNVTFSVESLLSV